MCIMPSQNNSAMTARLKWPKPMRGLAKNIYIYMFLFGRHYIHTYTKWYVIQKLLPGVNFFGIPHVEFQKNNHQAVVLHSIYIPLMYDCLNYIPFCIGKYIMNYVPFTYQLCIIDIQRMGECISIFNSCVILHVCVWGGVPHPSYPTVHLNLVRGTPTPPIFTYGGYPLSHMAQYQEMGRGSPCCAPCYCTHPHHPDIGRDPVIKMWKEVTLPPIQIWEDVPYPPSHPDMERGTP